MRNIDPRVAMDFDELVEGLRTWIGSNAPSLNASEVERLLAELDPERTEQPWWIDAVSGGLAAALRPPNDVWAEAVLRWLVRPRCAAALSELMPTRADVENELVAVVARPDWASENAAALLSEASRRGWSRLHARIAVVSLSAQEAIRVQRALQLTEDPGLEVIVEFVAGEELVNSAITESDTYFVKLVARRTARQPDLLTPIDPLTPAWRVLWKAHIEHGGENWPPRVDRSRLARHLLDLALDDDVPEFLLCNLAADMGEFVLAHERRAELWETVQGDVKRSLLDATATALLAEVEAGTIVTPELPLAKAAFSRSSARKPNPNTVAAFLTWEVGVTEQQLIGWLKQVPTPLWSRVALQIGQAIAARQWKEAAEILYRQWASDATTRSGVAACSEILTPWRRWIFGLGAADSTDSVLVERVDSVLVERVGKLGAELAPDELDALWERAGGKRMMLPIGSTPEHRWRAAVRSAAEGALKTGMMGLVDELLEKLPYNHDLQEVAEILSKRRRR